MVLTSQMKSVTLFIFQNSRYRRVSGQLGSQWTDITIPIPFRYCTRVKIYRFLIKLLKKKIAQVNYKHLPKKRS